MLANETMLKQKALLRKLNDNKRSMVYLLGTELSLWKIYVCERNTQSASRSKRIGDSHFNKVKFDEKKSNCVHVNSIYRSFPGFSLFLSLFLRDSNVISMCVCVRVCLCLHIHESSIFSSSITYTKDTSLSVCVSSVLFYNERQIERS